MEITLTDAASGGIRFYKSTDTKLQGACTIISLDIRFYLCYTKIG